LVRGGETGEKETSGKTSQGGKIINKDEPQPEWPPEGKIKTVRLEKRKKTQSIFANLISRKLERKVWLKI